jgi:hypothetical protein
MEIASSPVMILSNYSDYYYVKVLWITCNLLRQPRWKLCEKTCQQKKSWIFFATSAHSQKVQNKFYLFYFIFKKYFKLFALNSTHCTVQQCVGKVVLQYFFLGGYVCVCVCVCVGHDIVGMNGQYFTLLREANANCCLRMTLVFHTIVK